MQPVLDVALGLVGIQRPDVAGRGDPLPELLHLRTLQDLAELRLAHQKALQQGLVSELEIRQHAQLFDRLESQVLRLVHDQQTALAPGSSG